MLKTFVRSNMLKNQLQKQQTKSMASISTTHIWPIK